MVRALVTGASGFVGGALLRRLADDPGFAVLGVGRRDVAAGAPDAGSRGAGGTGAGGPSAGAPGAGVQDGPAEAGCEIGALGHGAAAEGSAAAAYRRVDLAAPDAVERLRELTRAGEHGPFRPEVIVHAAARSSPWGTRAEFERDNVGTTRAVLEYARSFAPGSRPRLVFVSTASVVSRVRDQLALRDDEPVPRRFVSEYAASKHAAEQLVRGYPGEWVILRPRAVFGPGDTTLFPRIAAAAERGSLPRFRAPRAGGPVLSDLIYVDTLVEYLVRALTEPRAARTSLAVTNGEPVDLQREVFALLGRAGVPVPQRTVSRRTALAAATLVEGAWRVLRRRGEPPITRYSVIVYAFATTFDAERCRELLGEPLVPMAEGLERFARTLDAARAAHDGMRP
ncbi:NAD-dependent epimerase/dehydratase family protein [Herbiconiux sp. 11R-BC]|uniref:NAD-dependent epimerase/dehydratase family protein n=1 Tax=Herbiconiux sp. 11R-BC TaxID=3111637 RepID=UPI003C105A33